MQAVGPRSQEIQDYVDSLPLDLENGLVVHMEHSEPFDFDPYNG